MRVSQWLAALTAVKLTPAALTPTLSQRERGKGYRLWFAVVAGLACLLAGCTSPAPTPTPTATVPPATATTEATATAEATATVMSTPTVAPTATATPSPVGSPSPGASASPGASPSPGVSPSASPSPAALAVPVESSPIAALVPGVVGATASPAPSPVAQGSPTPAPVEGGTLTVGVYQDAVLLNPILSADATSTFANGLIFSRLVTLRPDGTLAGDLAERWEVSPDGKTYTFTLRQGVAFHDGKSLTSEDVRFTYATILNPETGSPRRADLVQAVAAPEAITAPDRRTVVFRLRDAWAPFLSTVATWGIVPQYILGETKPSELRLAPFNTAPVGSGPFKLADWQRGARLTLAPNPDYVAGKPHLEQIVLQVVRDSSAMAVLLRGNIVDWGAVDPAQVPDLRRYPALQLHAFDNFNQVYVGFQLDPARPSPVQELPVRQALMYAVDRAALVQRILAGQGAVARSLYPPPSPAADPNATMPYPYDPEQAKALLDAAGWTVPTDAIDGVRQKDGKPLRFYLYLNSGNRVREDYAYALEDAWKAIGVDAIPKPEEYLAFVTRVARTHDFEVFLGGFAWNPDPDESGMWATTSYPNGYNFGRYSNQRVDDLLAQANRATDRDTRLARLREVEPLIWADLPAAPLAYQRTLEVVNSRLRGAQPNAVNPTFGAHLWWLADGQR